MSQSYLPPSPTPLWRRASFWCTVCAGLGLAVGFVFGRESVFPHGNTATPQRAVAPVLLEPVTPTTLVTSE